MPLRLRELLAGGEISHHREAEIKEGDEDDQAFEIAEHVYTSPLELASCVSNSTAPAAAMSTIIVVPTSQAKYHAPKSPVITAMNRARASAAARPMILKSL